MGKINKILELQEENKRLEAKVRYYKKKNKEENLMKRMKEFCINRVGVDAGLIMICGEHYYDQWGNITNYGKNEHGVICSQKIKVKPGTYKVKWAIDDTWNGPISGEGTVSTHTGIITISDPCYCIRNWDKWLRDTNMAKDVSDDVILIDKMGGDGVYRVSLEIEGGENE